MSWDQPFDITKNADGSYTKRGKTQTHKPRFTLGTPRMVVANVLLVLLLIWGQFGSVVIAPLFSLITGFGLFAFIGFQFYLAGLAWQRF